MAMDTAIERNKSVGRQGIGNQKEEVYQPTVRPAIQVANPQDLKLKVSQCSNAVSHNHDGMFDAVDRLGSNITARSGGIVIRESFGDANHRKRHQNKHNRKPIEHANMC